ncbi:MAG: hypothetical protein ACFFE4_06280 [Candidatus Thorarchaeota archaeon]
MPCIHGLDEISCPTCRIIKSSVPINSFKSIESPALKIKSPFFSNGNRIKDKLEGDLTTKKINITKPSLNTMPKPSFINEPPNFENKLFLERAKELDISNDDNFGISKKIPLERPDWQFEEED